MTNKEKFNTLLEQVFDLLYAAADKIVTKEKPCEHTVNAAGHSCIGKTDFHGGNNRPQCCCSGCRHFNNGCTAEKPLTCKTWLCPVATSKHPETNKKLWEISNLALIFGFYISRGDKKDSIKNGTDRFCLTHTYFTVCGSYRYNYSIGLKKLIKLIEENNINVNTKFS